MYIFMEGDRVIYAPIRNHVNVVRQSWFQVYVFANTIIRVCLCPRTVSCEVVVFHPPPVAEPMPSCTCAIIEHRVANAD